MAPRPAVTLSPIPVAPPGVMISPLILRAQIVAPSGGGAMGLADTTQLENPFQAPMWLDEVRFRLPTSEGGTQGEAWSSIAVELKLGNLSLTRGYVPIALLGKVLNDSTVIGENGSPNVFTWKLPKPLFIPARELLRPTIYFAPYNGAPATSKVVTVIYCCRPLPRNTPTPRTLQVPWVTHFLPPVLSFDGMGTPVADTVDQSSMSDLFNPWNEELHVQRFVGRLMCQGTAGEDDGHMSIASANIDPVTGLVLSGTLVSAQDSMNNILIRDPTPFAHLFDFIDRAWTVNCRLPPKGFYLFTIDRLWSGYLPGAPLVATVGISMVGWREVAYYP